MKVALHECITIIIIKLTLFIFTLYFSPIEVKEKILCESFCIFYANATTWREFFPGKDNQ